MSKIETMLYGIYPRDEQLRIAISKWERGATTTSELSGIINKEKQNLLSVFKQSGLDHYTDPLVNWHDILRMVSYTISSRQLEKLGRYRETNTFYKQPEIDDYPVYHDIREQDADPDKFLPGEIYSNDNSDSYLHFLPGPESFLNMSIVRKELKREKILESLITVYKEIMKKNRMRRLVLFDPYPDRTVFSGYGDIFQGAEVYFVRYDVNSETFKNSNFGKPYALVSNSPLSFVNILVTNSRLPGVAIVDSQNTYLEDPHRIREKAERIGEENSLDSLLVTHTEYLDFLPRVIADKKVKILGEVGE